MDITEIADRLAAFDEFFVTTRQSTALEQRLRHHLAFGLTKREAQVMMVLGPTGSGKTIALRRFSDSFPPTEVADGEKTGIHRPILYVEAPEGCTLKSLAQTMLLGLGTDWGGTATQVQLTHRVVTGLRNQRVGMVTIDELQHVTDNHNKKYIQEVADWIKSLANACVCPLTLSGQDHVANLVRIDPQLDRRMGGGIIGLRAFDFGKEDERREYRVIINEAEKCIKLPTPCGLGKVDCAKRIHHFSGGLLGHTIKLLRLAYQLALIADAPCITYGVLADAVDMCRSPEDQVNLVNPFRVGEIEVAPPPGPSVMEA